MSIDPAVYEIQNVMQRNFAVQRGGTVVGYAHLDEASMPSPSADLGKMWSISRLDNEKYTVRNIETNQYAACPKFPVNGENIGTTGKLHQWAIKETGFKGRYVIGTTGAHIDLFWGLTDGELDTPISLRDKPNTPSNQWELRKVDLWEVVGLLRAKISDLQRWHEDLQEEHKALQEEHKGCTRLYGGEDLFVPDDEREQTVRARTERKAHKDGLRADREGRKRSCICM